MIARGEHTNVGGGYFAVTGQLTDDLIYLLNARFSGQITHGFESYREFRRVFRQHVKAKATYR